jgi:hypothetical protein
MHLEHYSIRCVLVPPGMLDWRWKMREAKEPGILRRGFFASVNDY